MIVEQAARDGGQVGARLPQRADFVGLAQDAQESVVRQVGRLIAMAKPMPPPLAKPIVVIFAE